MKSEQPGEDPGRRMRLSRRTALGGLAAALTAAVGTGEAWSAPPRSPGPSPAGPGTTPLARRGCTVTALHEGRILVAGGYLTGPLASTQIYDPRTDSWYDAAQMSAARFDHAAVALNGGRVLVCGGQFLGPLASAEIYDPTSDSWQTVASMNWPRFDHGADLLPGNQVIAIGGYNQQPLSSIEYYDFQADAWTLG